MKPHPDAQRREVLAALASLPMVACAESNAPGAAGAAATSASPPDSTGSASPAPGQGSRTLVAYLSRSGQTRVIAGVIQRALRADLFEIRTATPYPTDYFETVAQADREREAGARPPLAGKGPALGDYDTLYLCFPVWGTTAPPPIRSYLAAHALADKIVVPVITHGGYGAGTSLRVLAEDAPGARLQPALVRECAQERRTTEAVLQWLREGARIDTTP